MEPYERHRRSARHQTVPEERVSPTPYAHPSARPPVPSRFTALSPSPEKSAPPAAPVSDRIQRSRSIEAAPGREETPRRRMPPQIFTCMVLLFFVAAALYTGVWWMRAYLTQKENEASLAHKRIVDAHPLLYRDFIEKYAAEYNLQPALVAAIILNESSYDPMAESGIGARGLMQLRESTADWINNQYLHLGGYSFARMWDPETNIRFGCWYLGYLARLFRGDPVSVISAYHAGQGTVRDSWLTNRDISPDGQTLSADLLPEGSTKTYVRRVTRDYGIYDALVFHAFNSAAADPVSDPSLR